VPHVVGGGVTVQWNFVDVTAASQSACVVHAWVASLVYSQDIEPAHTSPVSGTFNGQNGPPVPPSPDMQLASVVPHAGAGAH
jgi:hypothetical protein